MGVRIARTLGAGVGLGAILLLLLSPILQTSVSAQVDLAKIYREVSRTMPGITMDMLEKAAREGGLTIYWFNDPPCIQNATKAFQDIFPFVKRADLYTSSGGPLYEKWIAEARARANVADTYISGLQTQADAIVDEGLVMNYEISSAQYYPKEYSRKGYYYPYVMAGPVIAWNPTLVSDDDAALFKTWDGLLDPRLGKYRFGTTDIAAVNNVQLGYYYFLKQHGLRGLQRLASLRPRVYSGSAVAASAVASGEVAVHFPGPESLALNLFMKSAPIRFVVPRPTLALPYLAMIPRDAPHPNTAKLWMEFVFSARGQLQWARSCYPSFRVGDSREELRKAPWYQRAGQPYWKYDAKQWTAALPGLIEEWDRLFRR